MTRSSRLGCLLATVLGLHSACTNDEPGASGGAGSGSVAGTSWAGTVGGDVGGTAAGTGAGVPAAGTPSAGSGGMGIAGAASAGAAAAGTVGTGTGGLGGGGTTAGTGGTGSAGTGAGGTSAATDAGTSTDAAVDGTPVKPTRPYKGVANSPCDWRTTLGVSWYYNWGPNEAEPCADPSAGGDFVPMIWGAQPAMDIQNAVSGFAASGATHVLGFNEPDHGDQANMSVDEAITLWPAFDQPGITVVSPAAASDGRGWFEDFMSRVEADNLRVDVVAVHWYGWNAGSCDANAAGFEGHIDWAESVAGDRPIWVTEWGCLNQSAPDEATVIAFFQGALEVLARHPRVERYAWYPWSTNCGLSNSDGTNTALGEVFAAAPAYR